MTAVSAAAAPKLSAADSELVYTTEKRVPVEQTNYKLHFAPCVPVVTKMIYALATIYARQPVLRH